MRTIALLIGLGSLLSLVPSVAAEGEERYHWTHTLQMKDELGMMGDCNTYVLDLPPVWQPCFVDFTYTHTTVIDCTGRLTTNTVLDVTGDPNGSGGAGAGVWEHLGFAFLGDYGLPYWFPNSQGLRYGTLSLWGTEPLGLVDFTYTGSGNYVYASVVEATECPDEIQLQGGAGDCIGGSTDLIWVATVCNNPETGSPP